MLSYLKSLRTHQVLHLLCVQSCSQYLFCKGCHEIRYNSLPAQNLEVRLISWSTKGMFKKDLSVPGQKEFLWEEYEGCEVHTACIQMKGVRYTLHALNITEFIHAI